jgi:hypothetical protein
MIKHILLALDGSDHARTAFRYALWLTERLQAELSGLHVIDVVSVEGPFFQDISGALGFDPYLDVTGCDRKSTSSVARTRKAIACRVHSHL